MRRKMTDQEILTKAIEKAVEGGWTHGRTQLEIVKYLRGVVIEPKDEEASREDCDAVQAMLRHIELGKQTTSTIFNHDFAKAFFLEGSKWINIANKGDTGVCLSMQDSWKHHLQVMVLEEEPLQYLKKFL